MEHAKAWTGGGVYETQNLMFFQQMIDKYKLDFELLKIWYINTVQYDF